MKKFNFFPPLQDSIIFLLRIKKEKKKKKYTEVTHTHTHMWKETRKIIFRDLDAE